MKWVLVVVVFGAFPVKTDLVFATLEDCLRSEDRMRSEYTRAFNDWFRAAQAEPQRYNYPASEKYMQRRFGLENAATCIPQSAEAQR